MKIVRIYRREVAAGRKVAEPKKFATAARKRER